MNLKGLEILGDLKGQILLEVINCVPDSNNLSFRTEEIKNLKISTDSTFFLKKVVGDFNNLIKHKIKNISFSRDYKQIPVHIVETFTITISSDTIDVVLIWTHVAKETVLRENIQNDMLYRFDALYSYIDLITKEKVLSDSFSETFRTALHKPFSYFTFTKVQSKLEYYKYSDLVGNVITEIEGFEEGSSEILIKTLKPYFAISLNGGYTSEYTGGYTSEYTDDYILTITNIKGSLDTILNTPIMEATQYENNIDEDSGLDTYDYKLVTAKGTLEWTL